MSATPAPARRPAWLVPVVVVLVAALLVVVSLLMNRDDETADAQPTPTASATTGTEPTTPDESAADTAEPSEREPSGLPELARRDADDPTAVGPVDAPLALVVFSDYQCPFCAVWSQNTQPAMLAHAEAGDLRIEFRDINVFGPDSMRAAQGARAAGMQGAYLEFHDALFEGGEKRSADDLADAALVALADELGLDVARFEADLSSAEVESAVQADTDEAGSLGIFSTPAFLLGDTPILGAQPTEVFEDAFADELARVQG